MKSIIVEKVKSAPKEPGVYIFYAGKNVLYVGKAANLRARLKSYLKITDSKIQSLNEEANGLSCIPLRSEIEALIEESRLIKELKPKYNILWRDDKSYLYVSFTRERMPKVFITHKNLKSKHLKLGTELIGPFTDGNSLRIAMKTLRRYFPYCTCLRPHFRDCLNAQIGKCFGFCCKKNNSSTLTRQSREYGHNIKMIKTILHGQNKKLLKNLEKPEEKKALEKIFEHREFLSGIVAEFPRKPSRKPGGHGSPTAVGGSEAESDPAMRGGEIDSVVSRIFRNGSRIECYDISNFSGKEAVGAMTALVKKDGTWMPDKNSYRKFKIKTAPTRDDPRMIYEVVSRRLKHTEWPYPNLIIIDGGLTQYRAALKAQNEIPEAKKIRIVAYPKPKKILLGWPDAPEEIKKLAEQAIYQTHNFVIRYHRQVRQREFLAK